MNPHTNLKVGLIAALGLNLLAPGLLIAQTDDFPNTQATLTLDIPGVGDLNVELTGPTQVTRSPIGNFDQDNLEDISLIVDKMDLQGSDPGIGTIQLTLDPQGRPSTGFAEESVNLVRSQLEPPFDSVLDMFVRVSLSDLGLELVNREPITLRANLSEIPPAPGEPYKFDGQVQLFDVATGELIGLLTQVVHIVRPEAEPFVEVDILQDTGAKLTLVGGPIGPIPRGFRVAGSTTVNVTFDGPNEGDANDDGSAAGLDEVQTELVELNLSGGGVSVSLNPARPSLGEIEELLNNNPGRLDLDPFHPGDAESFFDVFFEIDVGGGLVLHNAEPLRLQSVIGEKPPQRTTYVHIVPPGGPIELLDANNRPTGIFLIDAEHNIGQVVEIDEFDLTLGEIEIIRPDGTSEVVSVQGPTTVHVFFEGTAEGDARDDDGDTRDEVSTEMVALSLTGNSALGPVEVRLNPNIRSTGEIEELDNNNPGRLDLDPFHPGDAESFFDVFFEIEITTPTGPVVLHTESPKRMSSVITEKPPGPGDVYEGLETIPLFDENGNNSGFAIGAGRHVPRPPIEIDEFDLTLGEIEIIRPDGTSEVVSVQGPTTVHVFFEGTAEGDARDDDGDTRDEVSTEMVALSLTGNSALGPVEVRLNPNIRSTGEIEELDNNNPGRLDLDPFHPGDAESFFDVFFEIEITTPTGPVVLHTESPKRMSSVITEKPPGPGDVYEGLETIPLFDENGNNSGFAIGAGRHVPRPPIEIDEFDLTLGEIEIIRPDGTSEVVSVQGPTTVHVFFEGTAEGDARDDDGDTRDEVSTEMVALSLTGNSALGPVEVRLNPNIRSTGEIEELDNNNPGRLDLDPFHPGDAESFFDVFFEIEITTPTGPVVLHTESPKRMSSVITEKPPGPGDVYEGLETIPLFDENGNNSGFAIGAGRHVPNPPGRLMLVDIAYDVRTGNTTLRWTSDRGRSYAVQSSHDLKEWVDIANGVIGEVGSTSYTVDALPGEFIRRFFRVREE